ncbi:Conserved_hypothetical protein [Hexamita inflata]|uniref:Uncharacterized protein n=1 Tax=Hexamita inflata TaxID=28002 RepID=A0AA86NMS4_9EUKA|nr:Conserved hypothetical protein [Hexamita inflata]
MIQVTNQTPLIPEEEVFPQLSHLTGYDTFNGASRASYYSPLCQTHSQFQLFTKVSYLKDKKQIQVYEYDGQMTQIPNTQITQDIMAAQLSQQNKLILLTKRYTQTAYTFLFKKEKEKTIFETVIYYLKYPAKTVSFKSENYHLVHSLSSSVLLFYEKQHITFHTLSPKLSLSHFVSQLIFPPQIADVQAFNNQFVILYFIQKLSGQICVLELYEFVENEVRPVCKVTTRSIVQADLTHSFNSQFTPVSIIQQNGRQFICNYNRREILMIQLPVPLQFEQTSKMNYFERCQIFQYQKWFHLIFDGMLVLYRQDIINKNLQTVVVQVNQIQKTKVAFTQIENLISYDEQELCDFIDAIPFIAQETEVKTVQQAIIACREYISLFYLKNRRALYIPFQMEHYSIFNHIRMEIITKFQQKVSYTKIRKENVESQDQSGSQFDQVKRESSSNHSQVQYLQSEKINDLDLLQQIIERFGPRVMEFVEKQPDEESTCISNACGFETTILDASTSFNRFRKIDIQLQHTSHVSKTRQLLTVKSSTESKRSEQKTADLFDENPNNEDDEQDNETFQQFLQPAVFDDKFASFKREFDKVIALMACPAHYCNELQLIPRFTQILPMQQCFNEICIFDFQLQTINNAIFDNQINTEKFDNLVTIQSGGAKQKQNILFASLKRQIFAGSLLRSGYLSYRNILMSSNFAYWQQQARCLSQYKDTNTLLITHLIVSKVMINSHASFYQSEIPGIKHLINIIAQHLIKINSQKQSFIKRDFVDEYELKTFQKTPSQHYFELSSKEASAATNSQQQTQFVPESDGYTLTYQNMPFIYELGFYDKAYEDQVHVKVQKILIKPQLPKYCIKNLSPDQFRLVALPNILQLFQQTRYLFEGVQLRDLYDLKLNQPIHSTIAATLNYIKQQYVENVQPVSETFQLFQDIINTSITSTIEYLSTIFDQFEHQFALLEVAENFQCTLGTSVQKMVIDMIEDDEDLLCQLKSYGVV